MIFEKENSRRKCLGLRSPLLLVFVLIFVSSLLIGAYGEEPGETANSSDLKWNLELTKLSGILEASASGKGWESTLESMGSGLTGEFSGVTDKTSVVDMSSEGSTIRHIETREDLDWESLDLDPDIGEVDGTDIRFYSFARGSAGAVLKEAIDWQANKFSWGAAPNEPFMMEGFGNMSAGWKLEAAFQLSDANGQSELYEELLTAEAGVILKNDLYSGTIVENGGGEFLPVVIFDGTAVLPSEIMEEGIPVDGLGTGTLQVFAGGDELITALIEEFGLEGHEVGDLIDAFYTYEKANYTAGYSGEVAWKYNFEGR
ncbi:hypothetical protein KGY71_04720 [Candidatus Bipolaricaulota bacterium]|nr:hypothetical protein [Candidatus Bipolaricaulota bacterium]